MTKKTFMQALANAGPRRGSALGMIAAMLMIAGRCDCYEAMPKISVPGFNQPGIPADADRLSIAGMSAGRSFDGAKIFIDGAKNKAFPDFMPNAAGVSAGYSFVNAQWSWTNMVGSAITYRDVFLHYAETSLLLIPRNKKWNSSALSFGFGWAYHGHETDDDLAVDDFGLGEEIDFLKSDDFVQEYTNNSSITFSNDIDVYNARAGLERSGGPIWRLSDRASIGLIDKTNYELWVYFQNRSWKFKTGNKNMNKAGTGDTISVRNVFSKLYGLSLSIEYPKTFANVSAAIGPRTDLTFFDWIARTDVLHPISFVDIVLGAEFATKASAGLKLGKTARIGIELGVDMSKCIAGLMIAFIDTKKSASPVPVLPSIMRDTTSSEWYAKAFLTLVK
jgi:hypothetical protein